ncbi:hypothetical protein LINGRAHAP2_LOCUS9587, partial [Linum grandiflorum]
SSPSSSTSQHPRLPIPVRHRRRRLQRALPQPLDALRFETVIQGRLTSVFLSLEAADLEEVVVVDTALAAAVVRRYPLMILMPIWTSIFQQQCKRLEHLLKESKWNGDY